MKTTGYRLATKRSVFMSKASYKSKWIKQGFDEGYLSAIKDVLTYKIEFEKNSVDSIIIDMELKRKEFLKYWDIKELEFINEDELSIKAFEVWND